MWWSEAWKYPAKKYAAVACMVILAAAAAPLRAQASCDNGVISLPAGINGTVTICSAVAAQAPELARQLSEILKTQGQQKENLAEIRRLVKALNSVSQNFGEPRQAELLKSFSARLDQSQKAGNDELKHQIADLAENLDGIRDQLVGLLTNKQTAEKTEQAVNGPVGDAIARLDLGTATNLLDDIRAQLKAIGSGVNEVNERTKEIQEKLNRQPTDVATVANALAAADLQTLKRLREAAVPSATVEEALRQKSADGKSTVARRFFENSARSSEAIAWLDAELAAGVDPNMTVPSDYYVREGILLEAERAGNLAAVKTLLRRGASPHAYQDLFLTAYDLNRFMFPLDFIARDDRFTVQEKREAAQAMMEAGLVIPKVLGPRGGNDWTESMMQAKNIQEKIAPKLGIPLPVTPTLCERPAGVICKRAAAQTHQDWCGIVAAMPRKLEIIIQGGNSRPLYNLDLLYLLAATQSKAYFLGLTYDLSWKYVLVEVSKDASSWTVLKWMSPEAGMGLCKKDEESGYQPSECWRRMSLERVGDQMKLEDWGLSWTVAKQSCPSSDAK